MSKSEIQLPPPPTRPRKIIQMKPKDPRLDRRDAAGPGADPTSFRSSQPNSAQRRSNARGQGAAAAAGGSGNKKTARKTAHSIIERRRRSKMNEEFDTLKALIPACRGQAMHKLSILQAGIEYLRYLEQCVADLKAAGNHGLDSSAKAAHLAGAALAAEESSRTEAPTPQGHGSVDSVIDQDDDDSDMMDGDPTATDIADDGPDSMDGLETIAHQEAFPPAASTVGRTFPTPPPSDASSCPSRTAPVYTSPILHPQSQAGATQTSPFIHAPHPESPYAPTQSPIRPLTHHRTAAPIQRSSRPIALPPLKAAVPSWRAVSVHSATATVSAWSSSASSGTRTEPSSLSEPSFSPVTPGVRLASPGFPPKHHAITQHPLLRGSMPATAAGEQEATDALLLLNCERRASRGEPRGGLRVKDLLSA